MALPVVAGALDDLALSVSLKTDAGWHPIHVVPNVSAFEVLHGVDASRWPYNDACYARARRDNAVVVGEHAGFRDLFVPVADARGPWAVLVAGPVATARPTSGDLLERWRWLTGAHGHAADPDFAYYVSAALSTLTLEGGAMHDLEHLLACIARLLGGAPNVDRIASEIALVRLRLSKARFAERMWEAARTMVDARTSRGWSSLARKGDWAAVGVKRLPAHAVVGLLLGRSDADPIDDLLRRDAFQRACAALADKRGRTVCGRVGDHGVVLLVDSGGPAARVRPMLVDLGVRTAGLAKRFGLELHVGISRPDDGAPLPDRYQSALSAAERALSHGVALGHASRDPQTPAIPLGELCRRLAQVATESPNLLASRFDRYVEAAALHCGYRADPTRAHLEAAFDQMADALADSGVIDPKSLADQRSYVGRAAAAANTIGELGAVFRRATADLGLALMRPKDGRQGRSLRRAMTFIRDHLGEKLTLARVSRIAGFAPRYFAGLFRRSERTTLHRHILRLRLVRAKQMLIATTLSVERVGQLCGFATSSQFHRAFKQALAMTPAGYRARPSEWRKA
jgi:AraC-like DNA-binding protein